MAQEIVWHSIDLKLARDTETGAVTIVGPPEALTTIADHTQAADLADKVGADIGPKLTGTETWPTVQTLRTLANVKRSDVTTVSGVMQIIVWLVPVILRTARLACKAYRIASNDATDDTATE